MQFSPFMVECSSRKVVVAAIGGNLAIAIIKFLAAGFTGSSAMLSEGIHSLVDTADGGLMLFGLRQSRKPADDTHPFGHGKELCFWSLVVAVAIFAVGGGISIYEGILHLIHPRPLDDPTWNYVVLGLSMVFEGISWSIALKEFQRHRNGRSIWQTIHTSKDPSTFMVLMEDSAALLGLTLAFAGVFLAYHFSNARFDSSASILIGGLLAVIAVFLMYETKGLLVGEGADKATLQSIRAIALADAAVEHVRSPLTMYFGPHEVLLTLEIQFHRQMTAQEVASAIKRVEDSIRRQHSEIKRIFIETMSLAQ